MTDTSSIRRASVETVTVLVLLALPLALYRNVVRLWWTWDDPGTLRTVIEHSAWRSFFDGQVWPQKLFTPLLNAFFELDLALFGLDAERHYLLHLGVACAATLAVYATARSFLGAAPARSAAIVFAAGVPLCGVVTQLSTVHYLLAILFGSLAAAAWHFGLRRNSMSASIAAGLLFLMALLAKEAAAPLPFVLLSLPLRDFSARLRHSAAMLIALAVYLAWRYAVLDTFLGGYGWAVEADEWPRLILLLPWRMLVLSAGPNAVLGSLLIGAIVLAIVMGLRSRRARIVLLLAAAVSVAPFVPVAKDIGLRYAIVPWLVASIAFAVAADRLPHRRVRLALFVIVPILTIAANRQQWVREFDFRLRMSDEARFFFGMSRGNLLRNPLLPAPQMRDLSWIRTAHLGHPEGGTCFYDDLYLCTNDAREKRVWQYEPRRRVIVETTARVHCGSPPMSAPLAAHFWYRDSTLHWELGPYRDGHYVALIGNGLQSGEIFRRNALRLPETDALTLRIRYDSPQGWTTYSPELALDFRKNPEFRWSR